MTEELTTPRDGSLKTFMKNPMVMDKLKEVLGKNAQSFATTIMQVASNNTLLAKASNISVYSAALTAATMNLSINPNLGHAYIVPFNRSFKDGDGNWQKICEAQLQVGWKGFVQLAQRSGEFKTVNTTEVYENQLGEVNYKTGETEILNIAPDGKVVGFIAHFALRNGFEKSLYMDKKTMEAHAKKYSQSYKNKSGVWADGEDGFNAMAKKTVLKLLISRFAPLSVEMQTAIQSDQAVVDERGDVEAYPDRELIQSPEEAIDAVKAKKEAMRATKINDEPNEQ